MGELIIEPSHNLSCWLLCSWEHFPCSHVPFNISLKDVLCYLSFFQNILEAYPEMDSTKTFYRRTIQIPQSTRNFKGNCCLKVHNVHLNVSIANFGIRNKSFLWGYWHPWFKLLVTSARGYQSQNGSSLLCASSPLGNGLPRFISGATIGS